MLEIRSKTMSYSIKNGSLECAHYLFPVITIHLNSLFLWKFINNILAFFMIMQWLEVIEWWRNIWTLTISCLQTCWNLCFHNQPNLCSSAHKTQQPTTTQTDKGRNRKIVNSKYRGFKLCQDWNIKLYKSILTWFI